MFLLEPALPESLVRREIIDDPETQVKWGTGDLFPAWISKSSGPMPRPSFAPQQALALNPEKSFMMQE